MNCQACVTESNVSTLLKFDFVKKNSHQISWLAYNQQWKRCVTCPKMISSMVGLQSLCIMCMYGIAKATEPNVSQLGKTVLFVVVESFAATMLTKFKRQSFL